MNLTHPTQQSGLLFPQVLLSALFFCQGGALRNIRGNEPGSRLLKASPHGGSMAGGLGSELGRVELGVIDHELPAEDNGEKTSCCGFLGLGVGAEASICGGMTTSRCGSAMAAAICDWTLSHLDQGQADKNNEKTDLGCKVSIIGIRRTSSCLPYCGSPPLHFVHRAIALRSA